MSAQVPAFLVSAIPEDDLCDIRDELQRNGNERQRTEIEKMRVQTYGEDIPFKFHWYIRQNGVERSYDYEVYLSRSLQRKVVNTIVHEVHDCPKGHGRNVKRILGEKLYKVLTKEVINCATEFEEIIRQDFTIPPPIRFRTYSNFISSRTKFPDKITLLTIRNWDDIYVEGFVSIYLDP